MLGKSLSVCAFAASLAVAAGADAATLRVPEDYASILAAVDAAVSGDSVVVGPGTWTDSETRVVSVNGQSLPIASAAFLKPGITVKGSAGPARTIVDLTGVGDVLVHTTPGVSATIVEGFTLTGSEGLVASQNSPLELKNCWLLGNASVAVEVSLAGSVVFRECRFEGNEWKFPSGQVGAVTATNSTIGFYNCDIRDNLWRAMRVVGSTVIMDNCSVSGNVASGGCTFDTGSAVEVRNCLFTENVYAGSNGGALQIVGCTGTVEFNVFAHDSAKGGGGLAVVGGSVTVANNTFYACDALVGGAMQVSGPDPGVYNNIFAYSTGTYGAVDRTQGSNNGLTGCNLFWANENADFSSIGTWVAAPTDIFADPGFCDHPNDDLTLQSTSPAAPANSPVCGLIGALDIRCGPVSVESESWGRIKGRYRERE